MQYPNLCPNIIAKRFGVTYECGDPDTGSRRRRERYIFKRFAFAELRRYRQQRV